MLFTQSTSKIPQILKAGGGAWKHRCNVFFDNLQVHCATVIRNVNSHMNNWCKVQTMVNTGNGTGHNVVSRIWKRPEPDVIKINLMLRVVDIVAGLGLIARNNAGTFNGARSAPVKGLEPEEAEALAALEGIKWAAAKGFRKIHIEGDSQNVVNVINGKAGAVARLHNNIIQDCQFLLEDFEFWICSFVHRDANNTADSLAKHALSVSVLEEWLDIKPSWLETTLTDDSMSM